MPRLKQNPRYLGRDAEAQIGGHARAKLHRRAPGDHFFHPVIGGAEAGPGPHDLARDGRVIGGFAGLLLVGVDDDKVDQMPRHPHVMRTQRPPRGDTRDLRDDQPAMVAHADRLFQTAEIGALMLIGQVAEFIRRRRPQDADGGDDIGEMQPGFAVELHPPHDGLRRRAGIHRAALADRIGESVEPGPGQDTGTAGGGLAVHVEHDAGGDVIGRDPVLDDHLPDLGHRQVGGTRRVGPRQHFRQKPVPGDMVDALHPVHVPRRNRVQRGQAAGMALGLEPLSDGLQHQIRATERGGGGDGDNGPVRDTFRRRCGADDLAHALSP